MSDLSFLIQNQNSVQIDQSCLNQCQEENYSAENRKTTSGMNKLSGTKQIHLQKKKSRQTAKTSPSLQRSLLKLFPSTNKSCPTANLSSTTQSQNQQLTKISLRMDALQQNTKRLEQRMGTDIFHIKEKLEKQSKEQYSRVEQVNRIKNNLVESKKKIGQLLALIMVEGK